MATPDDGRDPDPPDDSSARSASASGVDVDTDLTARPRRTIRTLLPILSWLPRYAWGRDTVRDLVAGVALAALLIPESLGYAGVAGVPAELGLYAALAAIVAYAVTGGTSILVVGPASGVAALTASIIAELGGDADPVVLAAALATTSGILLLAAGILRLGWIVNFISRPVLEAFVAGLSISIVVGQLDGLLGTEVDGESAIARLVDLFIDIAAWDALSAAIGVGGIVTLLLLERFVPKVPAALVVVAVGIVLVAVLGLADEGVAVVGEVPTGLPDVALPDLSRTQWLELFGSAFALVLVGLSEGYAAASEVAEHTGETVDPDQELIGTGAANLAAGVAGGIAVSGSLSKSAASRAAGARTQMANLAAGAVVLATLLFLAPLFEDLPEPVLAAVVIVAVLGAADPRRVAALWSVNRFDFAAGVVTFVLVLIWEPLQAMVVGVVLSLAFVVRRASFPDVVEVGRAYDGELVSTSTDPAVTAAADHAAVLRLDGPLIYANADRFTRAAEALVKRRPEIDRLVLDAEVIADLDATGAEHLEDLDDWLGEQGITLVLARVHHGARAQIVRSRLRQRFDGRIHTHLEDALADPDEPRNETR
jgi:SulP family sulfate permease